jgi:GT2 family glycosyltransferase
LASIAAQTHTATEVIVVDNRSPESERVAIVVAEYTGVRLVANPTNLGFTGGMNVGLRLATGDCVLLTEDDIVLDPGAVAALVDHDRRSPGGLAGPVMYNKTTGTVRCAGGLIRLGPRFELKIIGEDQLDVAKLRQPIPVTYLPGAFLFAGRAVWRRLGGFRDLYYMYMEDIDLCLRAAAVGIRLEVVPGARIWHFDPPAGSIPAWLGRLKARNLLRVYLLNASPLVLPEFILRYYIWGAARDVVLARENGWGMIAAFAQVFCELPQLLRERRGWIGPNPQINRELVTH